MAHWARTILEQAVWQERDLPHHVLDGLNRLVEHIEESEVYQFRIRKIEAIADEISVCEDLVELSELLWLAATSAGFQHFSVFVLNQGQSPAFASRMCASYSPDWLKQYEEKSYQYVDPILARARNCVGSFTFAQIDQACPLVEDFWRDAERHRIGRNGLYFVIVRPNGARIAVSFASQQSQELTDEIIRLNGHDLHAISQLAVECFAYVSSGSGLSADVLSVEELRFLHLLSTNPDPGKALAQAPQYGGNQSLQASIRKKLNATSIFQAVSMASAMQWFDDLPIYADEIIRSSPSLSGWNVLDAEHAGKLSS